MAASGESAPATTFTVGLTDRASHLFDIEMAVAPFAKPVRSFDLCLPAWTPGSYFIRDHARHVRDLAAFGPGGERLAVRKVGKARWRVEGGAASRGPFRVGYRVYAFELTVRTSHLDASHGYGNGATLFFHVEGRKGEPHRLRFRLPRGGRRRSRCRAGAERSPRATTTSSSTPRSSAGLTAPSPSASGAFRTRSPSGVKETRTRGASSGTSRFSSRRPPPSSAAFRTSATSSSSTSPRERGAASSTAPRRAAGSAPGGSGRSPPTGRSWLSSPTSSSTPGT